MIKTTAILLEELKEYASPANKLARLVKSGVYYPLVKGIYETDPSTPGYLLAGSIYAPSYLSFEFALAYHGLIPEAVYTFTSATFEKKKKKTYNNHFGIYTYRDVPSVVFPLGVNIIQEGKYSWMIASAEKAICDQLYKMPPVANQKELVHLLFDNLRIDQEEWKKLNYNDILKLGEIYHCTNIQKLCQLIRRKKSKWTQ